MIESASLGGRWTVDMYKHGLEGVLKVVALEAAGLFVFAVMKQTCRTDQSQSQELEWERGEQDATQTSSQRRVSAVSLLSFATATKKIAGIHLKRTCLLFFLEK